MQNNVISGRITSLYGTQHSFVTFAYKTATLGPELQVSMEPRPHLLFFAFKTATNPNPTVVLCMQTAWLAPELLVSTGPRPHLSFCACTTTWLASELLVPMGPSPYLWFSIKNSGFSTRIASLYGSQTSPVDLWIQNSMLRSRMTLVYLFQPSCVV